jgi:ribokinase
MAKILVLGSSNVDMIMQMERLPALGETVIDGVFTQTFGGKGANSAVAAARAGGNIQFVNCVGEDVNAPVMIDLYASEGINVDLISREEGVNSGTALIMIGSEGTNYLSVAPGANYRLTPQRIDAIRNVIESSSRIVLQCEIPIETNIRIIEIASELGVPVQLNLAPACALPEEVLKKVDTLIVNEVEARFLMEQAGIEMVEDKDLACALMYYGAQSVIVTLGPDGAVLSTKDGVQSFPALPVNVVDTTAAGDTFCGAYAVATVEGMNQGEAMQFASAASALAVSRLGAIPSTPKREEIDQFLQS